MHVNSQVPVRNLAHRDLIFFVVVVVVEVSHCSCIAGKTVGKWLKWLMGFETAKDRIQIFFFLSRQRER